MTEKQRKKQAKKQLKKALKSKDLPIGVTLTFHMIDEVTDTEFQIRVRT